MAYYNAELKRYFKNRQTSTRYMTWWGGKKRGRSSCKKRTFWRVGLDRINSIFTNIFSVVVFLVVCAGLVKIIMVIYEGVFPFLMKVIVIGLCGYMLARGFYVLFCFINEKNKAMKGSGGGKEYETYMATGQHKGE